MAEMDSNELEVTSLGESSLQDDLAHWADVLDHWVRSIDMGLGRAEPGLLVPDEADAGPTAE